MTTITKRIDGAITEGTTKRVDGAITESSASRVLGAITENSTPRVELSATYGVFDVWGGSWAGSWGFSWRVQLSVATGELNIKRITANPAVDVTKRVAFQ